MGAASESLKLLFSSSQYLEGVFACTGGPRIFSSIDLVTLPNIVLGAVALTVSLRTVSFAHWSSFDSERQASHLGPCYFVSAWPLAGFRRRDSVCWIGLDAVFLRLSQTII